MPSTEHFARRRQAVLADYQQLVARPNRIDEQWNNGVFERYQFPVVTARHIPPTWRYDFDPATNPFFMERLGINATFNAGALWFHDRYHLVVRVEGSDRKSFFAVASSPTGIDQFTFVGEPIVLPEGMPPETDVFDMRVTPHADGWIYGVFCAEWHDPAAPAGDTTTAHGQAGIVRTHNLVTWERLPNLITPSAQQRNVVLHPAFVNGQYAFYTRPQDSFYDTGGGQGIGFGLVADITHPVMREETIIEARVYHTIKEKKNGDGPPPIKTDAGWLHIAHGVRDTAAGLRYVLYAFLCDHDEPWRVIARPGGYLIAPEGEERTGDVDNVVFCNGVITAPDGTVHIYYGGADTRVYVATSSIERLIDYVRHTPEDGQRTATSVAARRALIARNQAILDAPEGKR